MRTPSRPPDVTTTLGIRHDTVAQSFGDPVYREFVRKAQDRYEHWDKLKHRAASNRLDPEIAWAMVKAQRTINAKPLALTSSTDQALTYWLSDAVQHELMMIDRELAGNVPKPISAIPDERQERFIIRSFMEEAISSSLLEGAPTTRKDAKQMLRSGQSPRSPGERMVANNYNAMLFIRDHLEDDLSDGFVHELHQILTHHTMPQEEIGRWRTPAESIGVYDERDGELMHEPPPAEQLPARMKRLYRFANQRPDKRKQFLHPVIQAIAVHFQLGYEHPYCDGNGRVARALFYWSALRNGYWLFEFLPISMILRKAAVRYSRSYLYTEYDGFDLGYFLTYQLEVISRARQEFAAYMERQAAKKRDAETITRADDRLNPRQRLLIRRLHENPGIDVTIAEHQHRSGVAYATARSDLMSLEAFGYITSTKRQNKFVFRANPTQPLL